MKQKNLLVRLRDGEPLSFAQQLLLIIQLSIPAIFAQVSNIVMQYIDASMVGRLGPSSSAAIGLVSSSTWLVSALCSAVGIGFSVQIAHRMGAKDEQGARNMVKQGVVIALAGSVFLGLIALAISPLLPGWLGGENAIQGEATLYFAVFALFLPVMQMVHVPAAMIQCSGNMKFPAFMEILMCMLDVVFNALLIFPSGTHQFWGLTISLPGANLGLMGAALGTGLAELVSALVLLVYLLFVSPTLKLRREERFRFIKADIKRAVKISVPYALEHTISCGAYVAYTRIVSPLGSVALAANSFAITAESLCYMPGYGISSASTTLIGQSIGAKRRELGNRLGWLSIALGMLLMTISGAAMYLFAPAMIGLLTPNEEIRALGAKVLRIEAFAEPLYGASIVATGVFRGAGNTKHPCILNLISMWMVRIPLAALLARRIGLTGAWIAMSAELCVRGIIFIIWLARWMKQRKE